MITQISPENKCTGCSLCKFSCSKRAIEMIPDQRGFLRPLINAGKCVECKACVNICPVNNNEDKKANIIKCFAFRHKSIETLMDSTSGAAFSAITENITSNGGVVYGASFTDDMRVVHLRAVDDANRNKFRGAKYVQSDIQNVYEMIKKDIKSHKKIVFSGTPCQVHAIKKYLRDFNDENVIYVDIVCHGVPSPLLWHEYMDFIHKYYGEVVDFSFRYKPNGWHGTKIKIETNNGDMIFNNRYTRSFSDLYFQGYSLRASCRDCRYKCNHREGDITIGDFWGYDECNPKFKDEKGISLVLINSPKGEKVVSELRKYADVLIESNIEEIPQSNVNRNFNFTITNSEHFWNDFYYNGYEYVALKYTNLGIKRLIINYIKKWINYITRAVWQLRSLRK